MSIGQLIDCCGCGLCETVCVHNSIEHISAERKSELYVKGEKCIQCGLCDNMCPLKNDYFHSLQDFFYKAETTNMNILNKSSSGGIAHELAASIVKSGGVVYGAAWNYLTQRVEHMRENDLISIESFQGSKYVQSVITKEIYNKIKLDVKDKKVLFIGTPCQVAAVRSYTRDSNNLFCVDLICHGVPSSEMFSDQLKSLTSFPVMNISFRNRHYFRLRIDDKQNTYEFSWEDNPYYSLYMHFASLREYCYRCKFACNTRVGDITVGDYLENEKGYSCVVVNTEKGRMLFEGIINSLNIEEKPLNLLNENHAFYRPTVKPSKTDKFSELYKKVGLIKAYRKTFVWFRIKRKIKIFIGENNYKKIKNLLRK